ncbi:unnamed protein product [Natator depressus]
MTDPARMPSGTPSAAPSFTPDGASLPGSMRRMLALRPGSETEDFHTDGPIPPAEPRKAMGLRSQTQTQGDQISKVKNWDNCAMLAAPSLCPHPCAPTSLAPGHSPKVVSPYWPKVKNSFLFSTPTKGADMQCFF